MDHAKAIRDSIDQVFALRESAQASPLLADAVKRVKRFQAARFQSCYADLLASSVFGDASRFFLEELYGEADYCARDVQFARIAGTLTTIFPMSVVGTVLALAQLHALTEELDFSLAMECRVQDPSPDDATLYLTAWRAVGRRIDRQHQLDTVLVIGHKLVDLTRMPGLSLLLKLMRSPAANSGLESLQQFLERGFKLFATMARTNGQADQFLRTIEYRENAWIAAMFDAQQNDALALLKKPI